MKTALVLLATCSVAFGRVGEKLDDFKKRTGAKPIDELKFSAGYFTAEFFVDEVSVKVFGKDGLILAETYDGLTKDAAETIATKQPRTILAPAFPGQNAHDATTRVFYENLGSMLIVSTAPGDRAKAFIDAERKRKPDPKQPKVDKF